MDNLNLNQHISKKFNEELEDIRARVLKMGGVVEQQLKDAIISLSEMNLTLAESVVTNDYKVNALEVSIDEECTQILARRQPAASDLRLVIAVIKTITDLERIGDEAERVAKMAIHFSETKGHDNLLGGILHLGEQVSEMLHGALDAFARMDTHAAIKVAKSDSKADREYESILRELMTFMMEDPRFIPYILDVMWSARALERIGDRACNICEYVIYLVNGKDVRHTSLEQILADENTEN
ncbi:Phosphate transport system regulatory protein PhoU [hydrothermal vent metagenome]|uniref:Phosphate transport system regulatory protein PhoU n=1 Tax=hydrothermal vent metagenome TaxID=652676 RepID=A0A3B1A736_9ZZZZ